ncbi:hypothetical protein [Streptomyces griseoluteus]|uniref:hypothetical protein n=1 Tax=Streptomyces griseoluteus TaxID=29306 RepID=UPI00367C9A7B
MGRPAAEREDLARAVTAARAAGLDDRAWRIILLQWPQVVRRLRDNRVAAASTGLGCAQAVDGPYGESGVRTLRGGVLSKEGRLTTARARVVMRPTY